MVTDVKVHIDGQDKDPGTILYFKRVTALLQASTHEIFHSFYETIRSSPPPIPIMTKNLLLALAEITAQTLKVSSCYVSGGTNTGDPWPWEARELDPHEPYKETKYPSSDTRVWLLKMSVIAKNCLARCGG